MEIPTPRYRIGNDLSVFWAISNRDGSPYDLANKEVKLFVTNERRREEVEPILTTLANGEINNVVRWDFAGSEQRVLGPYSLTIVIRATDDHREIKRDFCKAFTLVGSSCEECLDTREANILDGGELILASKLDVYRFDTGNGSSSGGTISGLSDVLLMRLSDGDILVYDIQNGKWVNRPMPEGGGNADLAEYAKKSWVTENFATKDEIKYLTSTTYIHTQGVADSVWTIMHTMNKYPSVTVVDSAGSVVHGEVTYNSTSVLTVRFTAAFSGKAYLN